VLPPPQPNTATMTAAVPIAVAKRRRRERPGSKNAASAANIANPPGVIQLSKKNNPVPALFRTAMAAAGAKLPVGPTVIDAFTGVFPARVAELGFTLQLTPTIGGKIQPRTTGLLRFVAGVTVKLAVANFPALTATPPGLAVTENSGDTTSTTSTALEP
jgi:hypothetical protein